MEPREIPERTMADLLDFQVRDMQRSEAQSQRVEQSKNEVKFATVIAVNEFGDVQIDRFTDENGNGQWFSVLNRCVPEVGDGVAYTYIEGAPFVLGPVAPTMGTFRILPDQEIFDIPTGKLYPWRRVPLLEISPYDELHTRFPMPLAFDLTNHWWHQHFYDETKAYQSGGSGSESLPTPGHWIRLTAGSTSGNILWLAPRNTLPRNYMPIQCNFDFVVRMGRRNTTAHIIMAGVLNQPNSDPPNGAWFEISNSALKFVLRWGGTDRFSQTLTTPSHQFAAYTARIRCRQFEDDLDNMMWRYTFQLLEASGTGITNGNLEYDENGEYEIKEEYTFEIAEASLAVNACFGAQIRNNSGGSTPAVDIDYIGGWAVGSGLLHALP